ncbi:MAG: fusion protein [Robiginitomaculum sp.]|nr:MAG: fusion protein [Robiginitomaculum sp.]
MSLLAPTPPAQLEPMKDLFAMIEAQMGFVPNSMKIMARRPELLQAFAGMGLHVMSGGVLDASLHPLISWAASAAYGCRYCEAHTAHSATKAGISEEKLHALPSFETSALFSDAERAAMVFAQCMAHSAGMVGPAEKSALQAHYSEDEIFDIVAIVSFFGFLNRWNDTLETPIEDVPSQLAATHLPGWKAGKHQE